MNHNMDVQYQVKHSKWVWRFTSANRDLKMQRREGNEERRLKKEFASFQSLSQLFLPTYFVKCRPTQVQKEK